MRRIRAGSLAELAMRTAALDSDEIKVRSSRVESHAEMTARQRTRPARPRSTARRLDEGRRTVALAKRQAERDGDHGVYRFMLRALVTAAHEKKAGNDGAAVRALEGAIKWLQSVKESRSTARATLAPSPTG